MAVWSFGAHCSEAPAPGQRRAAKDEVSLLTGRLRQAPEQGADLQEAKGVSAFPVQPCVRFLPLPFFFATVNA